MADRCAQFGHRIAIMRSIHNDPGAPVHHLKPTRPLHGTEADLHTSIGNDQACLAQVVQRRQRCDRVVLLVLAQKWQAVFDFARWICSGPGSEPLAVGRAIK